MKEKKEGPAASTPVASTITRVKVLDKRHLCEICLRDSEDEELCTECDKNIPCKIYAFRGNDALRIMLDDAEFDNRNLSKEDEAQLLMMLECPTTTPIIAIHA